MAIKISNTTVINDSRGLENITNLKTVGGTSILGSGDIAVGSVALGGTGQTSYTNGQLLIGNTTGGTLVKSTLTNGTGISVTNGAGSITISNTSPDQTVSLTQGGATSISGTYPNFTISSTDTTYNIATSTTPGLVEVFSDTDQTVAANAVSATAGRTYGIQLNAANQMVVNVPWSDTDTNTTYSAGNGIALSSTTFSVAAGTGLTQDVSGLSLTGITAGSTTVGAVQYNGTTKATGQFYGGTTAPSNTTRLNYDGYLYATRFVGDGSQLTGLPSGGTGTVTSVAVSGGTTGLSTTGGPITTSGTITLGGTLAIANGGTGATSASAARAALGAGTVTSVSGTGTTSGLSLSGTFTTSGSLTLSGTVNAVNGYKCFGGSGSTDASGNITITFPSAFSSSTVLGVGGVSTTGKIVVVTAISTTSVTFQTQTSSTGAASASSGIRWVAVGT